MTFRGWIAAGASAALLASCAEMEQPERWSVASHRTALENMGVLEKGGDPWCERIRTLRQAADGELDQPLASEIVPEDLLAATEREGDILWPLRKGLICEYLDGAAEEREEQDWETTDAFLNAALAIASGRELPLAYPIYELPVDEELDVLTPVDFSSAGFCAQPSEALRGLVQQRGPLTNSLSDLSFAVRAPDWLALTQVAYHRWGREQLEGHQLAAGRGDINGGIPFHCSRYHTAYEIARRQAVKDNLIFLLPEFDNPSKSGRLEIRDAEGNVVVLDQVLAAAQLDAGGENIEPIQFEQRDVDNSMGLAGAVNRLNSVDKPATFQIFFEKDRSDPISDPDRLRELELDDFIGETGFDGLKANLEKRSVGSSIKVFLTGHADCLGSRIDNKTFSDRRAQAVFSQIIEPGLRAKELKLIAFQAKGEGETAVPRGETCFSLTDRERNFERRATVTVQ